MYIIELLAKICKEKRQKRLNTLVSDEPERCSHIFIPIDSTGEILACSKCGEVIKKGEVEFKPKNPFV